MSTALKVLNTTVRVLKMVSSLLIESTLVYSEITPHDLSIQIHLLMLNELSWHENNDLTKFAIR